jgi:hypothetical protein
MDGRNLFIINMVFLLRIIESIESAIAPQPMGGLFTTPA